MQKEPKFCRNTAQFFLHFIPTIHVFLVKFVLSKIQRLESSKLVCGQVNHFNVSPEVYYSAAINKNLFYSLFMWFLNKNWTWKEKPHIYCDHIFGKLHFVAGESLICILVKILNACEFIRNQTASSMHHLYVIYPALKFLEVERTVC